MTTPEHLSNTERKLAPLDRQIEIARARPDSDANRASLRSLRQMGNLLREEIIRHRATRKRQAS
jgi:hypothetical protein